MLSDTWFNLLFLLSLLILILQDMRGFFVFVFLPFPFPLQKTRARRPILLSFWLPCWVAFSQLSLFHHHPGDDLPITSWSEPGMMRDVAFVRSVSIKAPEAVTQASDAASFQEQSDAVKFLPLVQDDWKCSSLLWDLFARLTLPTQT